VPGYLVVGKIIAYALYVWVVFGIIMLGMRVFLLAFSANPGSSFVNFIYNTSASFLEPFRGIFPPKSLNTTGYLDVAALFAMIIYAFVGWGFSALIHYIQAKIDAYTEAAKEHAEQHQQAVYPQTHTQQAFTTQRPTPTATPPAHITHKPRTI
jgi:uncharacterized protein YggT (Ycf19 family)